MITKIYIGSDNTTKVLELEKIESIVNKYHKGYTIIQCNGYWLGNKENTAIVEICDELVDEIMLLEIKRLCKQDSLLISRLLSDNIFI